MLNVHRSERSDVLVGVLAERLAEPAADPMCAELVAVPTRGVERWLAQELACRLGAGSASDGICANIDFDSPDRIVRRVIDSLDPETGAVGGGGGGWQGDDLLLPVLEVLDESVGDPRLAVITRHLGGDSAAGGSGSAAPSRRLATARTIAELFTSYGWQRPTMLADWARGADTDGAGGELPGSLGWQPWLWRRLRDRMGRPHLAEQLPELMDRLREAPDAVDLPERFALFGPTRIPELLRFTLGALAGHREVDLYLPHPSDALWRRVIEAGISHPVPVRRTAPVSSLAAHPLLAGLSRDVQEMQQRLMPVIDTDIHHPVGIPPSRVSGGGPTLLAALQQSLRNDRLEPVESLTAAGPGVDTSLEVHACHGPERQVEVLRERLLGLFAGDETLEPRDVLVMCPDVEKFAPLIRGAFGQQGQEHPAFGLRVRVADLGPRATNPMLDLLAAVLELAAGRVRVTELLDLASRPPVRARFGFDDEELDHLADWLARSGVRWGVDAAQRNRFGVGFPHGTASTGVDRILLGVIADEEAGQWLGTALPLAGIDSTATDLAGRLAEFVERLGDLMVACLQPRSADEWIDLLIGVVDRLGATEPDTEWQRAQAVRLIEESLTGADPAEAPMLALDDIRDLLVGLLAARPTRADFRTGDLTVCTMAPMRSVPHRVVVLLGMDGDAFPRFTVVDGDDVLGMAPMIGERDRRTEDRQIFLDAITAATDHLLIFTTGADPHTGKEVPPSVVVSELIDATQRLLGQDPDAADEHGAPLPPAVVRRHPLHAFDIRNFGADAPADDAPADDRDHDTAAAVPFSHDRLLLAGARALWLRQTGGGSTTPRRLVETRLPDLGGDVELDDLISFCQSTVEGLVRQRLGVWLPTVEEEHPEQLPIALDGLAKWGIGDRYLSARRHGADPDTATQPEWRRGGLPPLALGGAVLREVTGSAEAVVAAAPPVSPESAETVDIRVELGEGRRLYGTVGEIYGDELIGVGFSRLGEKQKLAAWIRLLALAAGSPRPVARALVVGRYGRSDAGRVVLTPPDDARAALGELVALRDLGLRQPLALPLRPAAAAAEHFARTGNGHWSFQRAQRIHDDAERFRTREDDYLGFVMADDPAAKVDFETLCAALPDAGEAAGLQLPGDEQTPMFVRLASLLFGRLLDGQEQR